MSEITASLVKELRERTGAGMMECKKALVAAAGDIEKAIEDMRIAGQAKAVKKAGRTAAEGRIEVISDSQSALIVEINCETDFTANNDNFKSFVEAVAKAGHEQGAQTVEQLNDAKLSGGETVNATRESLVAKIGENMSVRRVQRIASPDAVLGTYNHGGRIGVVVCLQGGDESLAKDIAMHIAASNPRVVNPEDVPAEEVEKEREISRAQEQESGKPKEIIEKIIGGRIQKFLDAVSLVGQPFVKDPNQKVAAVLKAANAKVLNFVRFEVGEGIEKEQVDFAKEVMEQAGVR